MQAGEWLRLVGERSEPLFRDALIAATALERTETVLTRNVRDFSLFSGVEVETY
jgi:predicted nucleic acid-binding protein